MGLKTAVLHFHSLRLISQKLTVIFEISSRLSRNPNNVYVEIDASTSSCTWRLEDFTKLLNVQATPIKLCNPVKINVTYY